MQKTFKKVVFTFLLGLSSLIGKSQFSNIPVDTFVPASPASPALPAFPAYDVNPWASTFNYERVWVPRTPLLTMGNNAYQAKTSASTVYINGFGRTLQGIQHRGIGKGDVISLGNLNASKNKLQFLPFVSSKDTKMRLDGYIDQQNYYNSNSYYNEGGFYFGKNEEWIKGDTIINKSYAPGQS